MDIRTTLSKNCILHFPGIECSIEAFIGRGSNVIAYTGSYRDHQNPELSHPVLIRELFPYDPAGGITRAEDGSIFVKPSSQAVYDFNRMTFLRGNEVHIHLSKTIPTNIDVNINTFEYNNTLYSLIGFTGGRTLDKELLHTDRHTRNYNEPGKKTESLLRMIRILKSAVDVLQSFHEAGYLHLDISPDNILLIGEGDNERVILIDYNSVHTLREIRGRQSVYFSTKNGYTAPEVRRGHLSEIRECTDLYSMTAVLYRCLTGSVLTPLQMIGGEPVNISPENSDYLADCPESALALLRRILRKGLAVIPGRRYRNATHMLEDLSELEDRVIGRGITHWALWESGRARIRRALRENTALDYILDEKKIYPIYAETEDGRRISLLQNTWIKEDTPGKSNTVLQEEDSAKTREESAPDSREVSDAGTHGKSVSSPILLLGGGGMGKTTALFRLSCHQKARYTPLSTAVYYISLYGYRDKDPHYICDRMLDSLKFKPYTDSRETARRELMQLLDRPLPASSSADRREQSGESADVKDSLTMSAGRDRQPGESADVKDSPASSSADRRGQPGESADVKDSRADDRSSSQTLKSRGESPAFLLLLDGLNEALGDTAPLLEEIHTLSGLSGVQIILTGRSDPGDPAFRKLVLCRLEQTEVRRILSEQGILPPENMEIFDLLSFPMILSMYIRTVISGEKQLRLESRQQLLEDYFDAILEKDRRNLPAEGDSFMGIDAAVRYLLPEIAALSAQKQHSLTAQDLMPAVEKCYKELSHRAVTAVFPEWIGHTADLRLGASNADEWYGKAVLDILWKRMGLLVRDEQGGFRILHQIIEEYLLEKSRSFHEIFDREKRRQRRWGIMAALSAVLLAAVSFGIYNYSMRKQVQQREQEALRHESLSLAYSGETKLDAGDRIDALRDADRALPSEENERPYVAEAEYALTKALYTYEADRYHPVRTLTWENEAEQCVISEDGTRFIMLDIYGKLSCYDTSSGTVLWSGTVPYAGNSALTYNDLYMQKEGHKRLPEKALPYLYIDEQNKTVLCAGETSGASLFSIETGEILWELSYDNAAGIKESSDDDKEDGDVFHAATALVTEDGKTLALAVSKDEKTTDSGTCKVGRILFCDMASGKITARSGILKSSLNPEWEFTGAGGFLPYSSERTFYSSIHFKGDNTDINNSDVIIAVDPQTGDYTLGPIVADLEEKEGGNVSRVHFLPEVRNQDGEILHQSGLFYYTCTYDWDSVKGFTGKTVVGFAPGYGGQWGYSREIDFLPEANSIPEIIDYSGSVYLFSGNTIIRLNEDGQEDRFYLDKNISYVASDDPDPLNEYIIHLICEDGSITDFNIYTMNYDVKASLISDEYFIVRRNLQFSSGCGKKYKPFCAFPEDDSKSVIICDFMEDEDKIVIHDPTSEYDIMLTGYIYVIPDGFIYIFSKSTSLADGSYQSDYCGYVYDSNGEITDTFTFAAVSYTNLFELNVTPDGSFLFCDIFIYDLKNHTLKKQSDLMPDLESTPSTDFRSAAAGNDVLSVCWHDHSLTVWKNGEPVTSTAPGQYIYYPAFILVNDDNDPETLFKDVTTGENGLIIIAGSDSTLTDDKKLIGKTTTTRRGKGFAADYFLVYSVDTDEWKRIDNQSETPGFPILRTAENHKWFAAMDEDDRLLVYDASSGEVLSRIQTDIPQLAVKNMKFIKNDEYLLLLSGSLDMTYQIIRVKDGKTVYTWHPEEGDPLTVGLVVQEDPEAGRLYISSSDGEISGVCIDTEEWVTLFEAPAMCGIIGRDSFVQMNYVNPMQIQPLYPLEMLREQAKKILAEDRP